MLLEEYDEKAEREYLRKEAIEEGWKGGLEQGIELGSFEILASLKNKGILSFEQIEEQLGDKMEAFLHWYQERR